MSSPFSDSVRETLSLKFWILTQRLLLLLFPWYYSRSLLPTTRHPPPVGCYDLISSWLPLLLSLQLICGEPSMLQLAERWVY